jgi:hypothetical protein
MLMGVGSVLMHWSAGGAVVSGRCGVRLYGQNKTDLMNVASVEQSLAAEQRLDPLGLLRFLLKEAPATADLSSPLA